MRVADAVGRMLVDLGVTRVFGVVGSGNFHVTNAMVAAGATFVAARHEAGATTMADAYARTSGEVAAVTVHQGCGLTNTMTGLTEAAKSRTPLVVLAADVTEPRSNFHVDQDALARAVGAVPLRLEDAGTAVATAVEAFDTARVQRRTVVLNLPLQVQAQSVPERELERTLAELPAEPVGVPRVEPDRQEVERLVAAIRSAQRPVFVAGRGARHPEAAAAVARLAERAGALLATSAVARGLFNRNPWYLDVSGGFSSPAAAELIAGADLIVGWGCALNMWTMKQGTLVGPDTVVAQVDLDRDAIGAHRSVDVGVVGDVATVASRACESLAVDPARTAYRTDEVRRRVAAEVRWRDVPYDDLSTGDRIDPRTLSIRLDDILPAERVVGVDSGNFMGYPAMFLSVPDEQGLCFTQAYQSVGLGLATTIGAALAQPHRLPVAALGDGGLLMSASELETVARLGLPMVLVVYDDEAYGAEVHHFGPHGDDLSTVRFPPTDLAAIARGYGFDAVTVRRVEDLDAVADWVAGDRSRPLLVDAKVTQDEPAWFLEEAFKGH
jgi:thiamine pyrophosphate-dependent acetolactate synthase large subunit-like protein